jgi:lipopolysaccharide transport system permease protein
MNPDITPINPQAAQPSSLHSMTQSIWLNRHLLAKMSKRDVGGHYKGSALGLAWSFFNPILMLVIYTFVFPEIFKSQWGILVKVTAKQNLRSFFLSV